MSMRGSSPAVARRSASERVNAGISQDHARYRAERSRGGGRQRSSGIWVARLWRIGRQVGLPRRKAKAMRVNAPPQAESQSDVSS